MTAKIDQWAKEVRSLESGADRKEADADRLVTDAMEHAERLRTEADGDRREAAKIMFDWTSPDNPERKTQEVVAKAIGKSQMHVSYSVKAYKIFLEHHGVEERSWDSYYQEAKKSKTCDPVTREQRLSTLAKVLKDAKEVAAVVGKQDLPNDPDIKVLITTIKKLERKVNELSRVPNTA